VVWYAGQFYALFFLERTLRVDGATTNILTAIALALATPGFVFFGWLSDKIGRKPIILTGCLLAMVTYFPLFEVAYPVRESGVVCGPSRGAGDGGCRSGAVLFSVRSNREEQIRFHVCDIAQEFPREGGGFVHPRGFGGGTVAQIRSGSTTLTAPDPRLVSGPERKAALRRFRAARRQRCRQSATRIRLILRLSINPWCADSFVLVVYVTMVYGPIAALLVETVSRSNSLQRHVAAVSHRQRVFHQFCQLSRGIPPSKTLAVHIS